MDFLAQWLSSSGTADFLILNGYAGTGKTTVLAAFVAVCQSMHVRTVLLAPTGRAAKVLTRYSGKQAYTIHKQIYRETSRDGVSTRFSIDFNKMENTIFIIDEASMISSKESSEQTVFGSGSLLNDFVRYVSQGKNCRTMFVGDVAQLPPVGETISPALDLNVVSDFGETIYFEMDEVVRQEAGSGILFNATLVRCMIENRILERPKFDMGFSDIFRVDGQEVAELLETCYSNDDMNETILLTRSNRRANLYNQSIRNRILMMDGELVSGDMLMIVRNNYFYAPEQDEKQPMGFLANGDIVCLKSFRREENLFGFRFVDAILSFPDYEDREVECKLLLDTLYSESPSLGREQSEQLFREVEKNYMHITSRRKRYAEMREDPYLNAVQVKFAYAVTCHKSQGGQWKNVFIDRFLFGDEIITVDLLRWLYTALTRATEKVYLIGFDDGFFE